MAWQRLVDRHAPLVLALCRSSGLSGDDAGDVCQEVMLSAFRSLARYGGCRLSTWLYRIARRRIADHFRSPQRRHVPVGLLDEPASPAAGGRLDSTPEPALASADLRDAIARLDEPARSIVLAYYLGEVSVREIAREMTMAENTVKSHLHRARMLLRSHMGGSQ